MFNDWKFLNYNNTKKKIQKLFEIFFRLDLFNLEERLQNILNKLDGVDKKVTIFQENFHHYRQPPFPPTPPLPPPYPPLPPIPPEEEEELIYSDLVITNIGSTILTDYVNFEITIKNIGLKESSATNLQLQLSSLLSEDIFVPSLDINEEFITNIQQSFDPLGDDENYTFLAEVNTSRTCLESDYTNNSNSLPVTIKSQYAPDGHAYVIIHAHNPEGKELGALEEEPHGVTARFEIFEDVGGSPISRFVQDAPKYIYEHGIRVQIPDLLLGNPNLSYVMWFNDRTPNVFNDYNKITLNEGLVLEVGVTYQFTATFRRLEITSLIQPNEVMSASVIGNGNTYIVDWDYGTYANVFAYADGDTSNFHGTSAISSNLTPSTWSALIHTVITQLWGSVVAALTNIATENPITCPSNAFQHWFCDYNRLGDYPTIILVNGILIPHVLVTTIAISTGDGYNRTRLPGSEIGSDPTQTCWRYWRLDYPSDFFHGISNIIASQTWTKSGICNFMISSCPKDLENISF